MKNDPGLHSDYHRTYADPDQYQSAIRGGDILHSVLGRGEFRAELTSIAVGRLLIQRGRETLPRLASSAMPASRVGILGWLSDGPLLPIVRGLQMGRGEILSLGSGMQSHHRTFGPNDFVSLTLETGDLTRAAIDLTGSELVVTPGRVIRLPRRLEAQLFSAIRSAIRVARTSPDSLVVPQAASALEETLLRPMIMCLLQESEFVDTVAHHRHAAIARRFVAAVEANLESPLLTTNLCRAVGVPGRTLRSVCREQFGMSPHRFLALRRLNLIRRALLRADHHLSTVTTIATSYGVWELGRFAVAYKSLFGESPSATLLRPVDDG